MLKVQGEEFPRYWALKSSVEHLHLCRYNANQTCESDFDCPHLGFYCPSDPTGGQNPYWVLLACCNSLGRFVWDSPVARFSTVELKEAKGWPVQWIVNAGILVKVSCVLCTSSLDWGEPGLRCNVGEPQPRCRQLFSLKIGCHLQQIVMRADRNGIYQSIEFSLLSLRSYPTCKVPWRLKMCFANLAGGTGNFGSKYCTLVRTMTQQNSSWKFGHSESLKYRYQGWQVHTYFSSKDCTNLRGMASVPHQLSRSRLDLLFLTLRSGFWWVVYSPSFSSGR